MPNSTQQRILITGGFGFIGSHLIETLLAEKNVQIHVVDSLVTSPINVDAFLKRLGNPACVTFDLCTVKEYFTRGSVPKFDEIYHLASIVGPVGVLKHTGKILRTTVEDTYLIAEHALLHGSRLCDISTSEVYGGGRDGYCSENDMMIIPPKISARLEYAVAKLGCEVALTNMTKVSNLQVSIVRPFNVAGPRQATQGGFVLPRFLKQALGGEPITVYGNGQMVRAFTHVKDIANGIVLAQRKGKTGEAYNIGNPANKTTILELANRVLNLVGGKSKITFVDPKKLWGELFEEANDKYPDASRSQNTLGWIPKYDIEQTIRESLSYIRENRQD